MKRIAILLSLSSLLLLTACTKNEGSSAPAADAGDSLNCFTLCHDTIPEKCEDEIVNYEASGANVMTNDTIYNDEFCEAQCATWTSEIMNCVNSANSCDQIGPEAEYCITNEPESPFETDEIEEVSACDKACKNYSKCAGYGTGATATDVQEAYNTCYQECQNWAEETISCMSKYNADEVKNCMNITMCGLTEYSDMMK